jgi:ATP-dependent DNA helicase RecG
VPDLRPDTPISKLPGVGPARAEQLHALSVNTLLDLVNYFPRDYQYESAQDTIAKLQPNTVATTVGEVVAVDYIAGPRPRFEATLDDGTAQLSLTFFNGAYLRTKIHPGMTLKVKGKLRTFRNVPQMQNPKWNIIESDEHPALQAALSPPSQLAARNPQPATLHPLYPATAKLASDAIHKIISSTLADAAALLPETLPQGLLSRRDLLPRAEAYRLIHQPGSKQDAINARKRLVYDELLTMQLGLLLSRHAHSKAVAAPLLRCDKTLDARIRARFPFTFTDAQLSATYEILKDLASGQPMNRLLQGDVGSGKTAVAVYAMLVAVANKMQAALLAPTEVLAEQHYLTLTNLLASSQVTIELFTSRTKRQSKGGLIRALADGRIHIAIGTQALLQEDIDFANLGLIVIDEQHRLGVQQRATLRTKGLSPHYLVMTATPIPRTLALSYFADFDVSTIDRLPPNRTPIVTQLVTTRDQGKAWSFLKSEIACGRQAYIIVAQIGEDEDDVGSKMYEVGSGAPSGSPHHTSHILHPTSHIPHHTSHIPHHTSHIPHHTSHILHPTSHIPHPTSNLLHPTSSSSLLKEFDRLSAGPLKGLRVAMLHGKMDADEKKRVMTDFREHRSDVLMATTVIEVGIDVPNATTIVIMDADRFGLSQLHQLRGRVGRGEHASTCLLLSGSTDDNALSRLTALTKTANGFEIAELDLTLRGPGQFFGTRQHGLPEFRLADLSEEAHLLHEAREDAQWLLERDPKLNAPELRILRAEINKQFEGVLPLASVG